MGLVRTRHKGGEHFVSASERANGDILLFTADPEAVSRLNHSLKGSWNESIGDLTNDDVVSPSWTRGVLVTSGGTDFTVFEEGGTGMRKAYYSDQVAMSRPVGVRRKVAVGQSRDGNWLLVSY
jgi:hypothetical protein